MKLRYIFRRGEMLFLVECDPIISKNSTTLNKQPNHNFIEISSPFVETVYFERMCVRVCANTQHMLMPNLVHRS